MFCVPVQCGNRRDKLRIAALLTPCCAGAQLRSSRLALLASDADYKKVRLYSGDGLPAFASLGVGRIQTMDCSPLLRSAGKNSDDELFAFAFGSAKKVSLRGGFAAVAIYMR